MDRIPPIAPGMDTGQTAYLHDFSRMARARMGVCCPVNPLSIGGFAMGASVDDAIVNFRESVSLTRELIFEAQTEAMADQRVREGVADLDEAERYWRSQIQTMTQEENARFLEAKKNANEAIFYARGAWTPAAGTSEQAAGQDTGQSGSASIAFDPNLYRVKAQALWAGPLKWVAIGAGVLAVGTVAYLLLVPPRRPALGVSGPMVFIPPGAMGSYRWKKR